MIKWMENYIEYYKNNKLKIRCNYKDDKINKIYIFKDGKRTK